MAGLNDFIGDGDGNTEQLHIMNIEYREQFEEPVVYLFCRTRSGKPRWVEVEGHLPSFYIERDAYSQRVKNHQWVETAEGGYESIHGDDLARVYTKLPEHINGGRDKEGLREYFDTTWEADVFYTTRFLIDNGIYTHIEVDKGETWDSQYINGDYRVHVDDFEAIDADWKADPRQITVDIEVESPDGFPDPDEADQPVTAITAHDNYSDEYTVWVLRYEGWAYSDTEIQNMAVENRPDTIETDDHSHPVNISDVRVFDEESALLHNFNQYVADKQPDMLGGWNSSTTDNGKAFDYPYLINRCKARNIMSFKGWSPMEQVWDGSWGPSGKGLTFFDMMKAYKKTQYSKPNGGYGLENIANRELGFGKEEIEDIDSAWRDEPELFLKYNMRDVQAVVGIDHSAGVTDLFQNIRKLTGVQFENCHNPIDTLDPYIIRFANEQGLALPTNEKPDRSWFYGGHNFDPSFGRHKNAVYPDVWSEYPNAFRTCNMSPETIIGTKEDLEASEYTEEDCRWSYIDTRRDNVKQDSDPEKEKCYYLKPSIKKGFMNQVVEKVMGLKDDYDGTDLYGPVKMVVNAVWGIYGDSDSYGKGYRLFDWRVAESITLYGQTVIKNTADRFVDELNNIKEERGYDGNNAYLVGGDSVPANEPTLIRRNGSVQIVSIEDVTEEDEVWTDSGWSGVRNVIQKPNRKQLYTVWTKHGITHVTEDHGLIRDTGEEVQPTDVSEGESLLHENISNVDVSGLEMEEERAWLLGLFAAEGSCGIYECESGSKASWAINNQDREILEHAQNILANTFGISTKIDNVMESSNTMKLRLDMTADNVRVVLAFREMLYDGVEKRVPKEILNGTEAVQKAFVAGHHDGDGHIAHEHKEFDEIWSKHKHLAAGLVFLLRQLGHTVSLHVRTEQTDEYYKIRSVAFTQGNDDDILGVGEYDYDGEYVYDIETENHHFQSGIGSIIVHNTDSVMSSVPYVDINSRNDMQTVIDIAHEACKRTNDWYKEFAEDVFNCEQRELEHDDSLGRELNGEHVAHYIELEIESYAPWLFVPEPATKNAAGKKRYAEIIAWEEGEWFDPPEFNVTGIDVVRSDRATITREVCSDVLEHILRIDDRSEAREAIRERIKTAYDTAQRGECSNAYIARPKGMSMHPDEYGSPTELPSTTYRGAKYANKNFDWEHMGEGSKPQLLHIERVRGDWPSTYTAKTKEDGMNVDAVSVENPNKVPDNFVIDMDTQLQKTIGSSLTPILSAMNWSYKEIISDSQQTGIGEFM